jgi:universal stress protein E
MRTIRRILVAVKDLDAKALPEVAKAAQLARALGAKLEIFHAISTPVYVDPYTGTANDLRKIERDGIADQQARLERIAERTRRHGVTVTTHVAWDYPNHEAILRRARRTAAGLIVIRTHEGARGPKWLMRSTDWELLKLAPMPVLLVRTTRAWLHPPVLATVDPSHRHAKPARLDGEILALASEVAQRMRGSLHAMYAYVPPSIAGAATLAQDPGQSAYLLSDAEAEAHAHVMLRRAVRKLRVPPQRRHVVASEAVLAIPSTARGLRAQVVVMGALSRSGLKRLFIGNTAERVLDSVPCDVLIVRPPKLALKRIPGARAGMPLFTQPILY